MAFENVDYKSLDIPAAPFSDPSIIPDFPKNKVPRHIGVIMDGNGRWAQQRGLIRTDGHQAAEPVVFDTIAGAIEAGVRYLSLYTFSTENWKRSGDEVGALMQLFRYYMVRLLKIAAANNVRVKMIGDRRRFAQDIIDGINRLEEETKNNTGLTFVIAVNYGGRDEICRAAAKLAEDVKAGKVETDDITESVFASYLDTADIPDPDLCQIDGHRRRAVRF